MPIYGTDKRAATDTGQVKLSTPTIRSIAPTAVTKHTKQPDALDAVVAQNALGKALDQYLGESSQALDAQKSAKAAAQVGNRKALTQIEKESKNSGWEEFIFGKDATHAGAQQQVVKNNIRGQYNKDLAEIGNSANITPDEYYAKLVTQKQELLKAQGTDAATAGLISAEMDKNIAKLVNVQSKEHYGWKQAEGKRAYEEELNQTFDSFNLERMHTLGADEKKAQMVEIKRVMLGGDKPEGMTEKAQRISMLEVIQNSAKQGNSGPLLAAKAIGLDKTLSAGEQVKWDAAVRQYDVAFGRQIETIKSNADMQISNAILPHQVDAAAQQQHSDLQEIYSRSSGTPYAKRLIAGGDADVAKTAKTGRTMRDQLAREHKAITDKANKKKAELEVQAETDAAGAEYFATSELGRQADIQKKHAFTKVEKEGYFDTHLIQGAAPFMQGEPVTIASFGNKLRTDVHLQQYVKDQLNRQDTESPMIASIMETIKNGSVNMYDADGKPTPDGMNTVAMMSKLAESNKFVDMMGGKDAARKWTMRANAIKAGAGQQQTDKLIEAYEKNLPNQDSSGFSWNNITNKIDRRTWMREKMRKLKIFDPTENDITQALQDYRTDMVAFSDTKLANQTFHNRMTNDKTVINGQSVYGADYLNKVTDYNVNDLIGIMESMNLMKGKLGAFQTEGLSTLSQLPGAKVEVRDGSQGFFISSPLSSTEVFVSVEEMKQVADIKTEELEIQKIQKRREKYQTKAWQSARSPLYAADEVRTN